MPVSSCSSLAVGMRDGAGRACLFMADLGLWRPLRAMPGEPDLDWGTRGPAGRSLVRTLCRWLDLDTAAADTPEAAAFASRLGHEWELPADRLERQLQLLVPRPDTRAVVDVPVARKRLVTVSVGTARHPRRNWWAAAAVVRGEGLRNMQFVRKGNGGLDRTLVALMAAVFGAIGGSCVVKVRFAGLVEAPRFVARVHGREWKPVAHLASSHQVEWEPTGRIDLAMREALTLATAAAEQPA